MSDVTLGRQTLHAPRIVPLPHDRRDAARVVLEATKDGYDTIGVRLPDGQEKLILTRTSMPISFSAPVKVDGAKVMVTFVENEANTPSERANDVFETTVGKVIIGAAIVVPLACLGTSCFSIGTWLGANAFVGGLLSTLAAVGVVGVLALGSAIHGWKTPTDDAVAERAAKG